MTTYEFDISIKATSKEEAVSKLKAVSVVLAKLNTKELVKLADIIANDPVKTALAKNALGV
jgi:hypothetical protein